MPGMCRFYMTITKEKKRSFWLVDPSFWLAILNIKSDKSFKKTYVKLFVVDICPVTQVIWKCRQIFVTFLPSSKAWTFHLNTYKSNNFPSSYWPSKSVFDNWVLNTGYTPAFVHGYPKYKTRTIRGIFFLSTVIPYLKADLFYEKG